MPRKDAVEMIEEEIEQSNDGTVDFDKMVDRIIDNQGVQRNSASTYIYDAESLEHKWTDDGDHIVRESTGTQTSVVDFSDGDTGDRGMLKKEVGEPTDDRFAKLPVLEDVDHPLVPDNATYFRRRLEGHKTDVQIITYDLAEDKPPGKQHVMLTGLPGVGKNQAIKHICAETNRPMIRIPVGGGIRYEDLVGHYSPTPEGGLEWVDGILTTAARYGYLVVLDEIDMMSGDVSSPLHQITEDGDSQELVIRQTGEVIDPHPQFRVVATRNPGFSGAKQMNDAFVSRFSEHEIGFLKESAEKKVVASEIEDVTESELGDIIEFANDLRDRYPEELDLIVTTRDIKRIAGYVAGDLFDEKAALRKVLLPRADRDTDRGPLEDEIDMKF